MPALCTRARAAARRTNPPAALARSGVSVSPLPARRRPPPPPPSQIQRSSPSPPKLTPLFPFLFVRPGGQGEEVGVRRGQAGDQPPLRRRAQHPHRVRPEEPPRAVLHDEARLRARQADGHVPHGEPGGRCPVGPVAARGRGALATRNGARAHTAVVVRVGRVGLAQENGRGGGGSLGRSFGRLFGQGSSGSRARPASQRVVSFSSEQSSLSPASESSRAAAASYSSLSLALSLRRLARACGTSSTPSPSSRPRARSRTFTTRATSASRASKNQTGGGGAAVRGASQPSRHVRACERRGAREAGRRRTRGVWTRGRARVAVRDARSGKMAGRRRVSE